MDRLKKWFPVLAILLLVLIMTFPLFAAAFEWDVAAGDLISSFSTLLAGACAIAAALLTVNTMNKHNKAQIEKITEINEIEEFHRYKKDFEDQYQEIINEFIKSQQTNFKISKKNIFYVVHEQKNCIGVPTLNYQTLMIIRKCTENMIDMYNNLIKISPDSIPSATIILNIAEAIKTNIEICGDFLYCAEITDAIRNRDSAQYIAYKLSDIEIAHIIKLHATLFAKITDLHRIYKGKTNWAERLSLDLDEQLGTIKIDYKKPINRIANAFNFLYVDNK